MSNAQEEAKVITQIWAAALLEADDESTESQIDLLQKYTLPLSKHRNTQADVYLAESPVGVEVARKVWQRLLTARSDNSSGLPFYYCENGDTQVSDYAVTFGSLQR